MSKRGLHLYKRLALTTLTALIGLGGAAQADIHAAGPVYGGSTEVGGVISCRVFNFGSAPVSITSRQIFDNNNLSVIPAADTCGTPLGVGQSCVYVASITGLLAYSCRVIDSSTSSSLSGAAEIQGGSGASAGTILNALPFLH
jgi:hypothetical protein